MEKFRVILISFVFPFLLILSVASIFKVKTGDKFYVIRTLTITEKKGKMYYEKTQEIKSQYLESGLIDHNKVRTKCKRLTEETMECVTDSYNFDTGKWTEVKNNL